MKIDMHMHITPPDLIRDYKKIGEKEPYFKWLSETPHNRFATADQVVQHLETSGFDKGVVFGFGFRDIGLCRYVNDYTMEVIKCYPQRLVGFMNVPLGHKEAFKEIERCAEKGLKGIGELFPEGQQIDLLNLHHTPLKAYCSHYNLPVMLHVNELVGHQYAGKTKVPLEHIETFVKNHDTLTIILAHLGGGLVFYELMKALKEPFKKVYYDVAALPFLYDPSIYRVLREMGVLDKMVFGSDYPLLPIARYEKGMEEAGLTESEKKGILGQNALTIKIF